MSGPRTGMGGPPVPAESAGSPPPDLTRWSIGVIGLGTMGSAMAHRLADAGARLRVYNRSPRAATGFAEERGAVYLDTPAAVADGADLVLVSVADDDALCDVLDGAAGVCAAPRMPGVVVNTSTVAPATLAVFTGRIPLVAAGVLGNGDHARGGRLRCYVGGPAALVDRAHPVLAAIGHQVLRLDRVGDGMRLKIAMNLLMGLEMQALAEVVALGETSGLPRALVLDAVGESGFAAPVMRFKARRMAGGVYGDADFRLSLMAKDLSLALALGAGVDLPMATAAGRTHDEAVRAGLGDADCAAILRAIQLAQAQEAAV